MIRGNDGWSIAPLFGVGILSRRHVSRAKQIRSTPPSVKIDNDIGNLFHSRGGYATMNYVFWP